MLGKIVNSLPTASVVFIIFSTASLLLWRFWTFTVRTWIWPSEPRYMPSWIPFMGQLYPFFADCHRLIDDAVTYFGHTQEPFALSLGRKTIYCLSRPEDVTGILDGAPWSHGLNFSHFVSEIMLKFGMSPKDVKRSEYTPVPGDACWREGNNINPSHLNLIHFVESLYKKQFLDPTNLNILSEKFVGLIQNTLRSENLDFCTRDYNGCLYSIECPGLRREVSLYSLVAGTMVDATIKMLFGPYLHKVEPDIVQQVIDFNEHAWILFYGLPSLGGLAPICEPRDRIKAAFRSFIDLADDHRDEQCLAFSHLLKWMDVLGIGKESRVGLLLLFFFASIANEQNACYWFVAHIIYDQCLSEQVRQEIEPAWASGKLDTHYLAANCPTLDAVFNETLRQRTNTFGWRMVKERTVIKGKQLEAGVPVIIPMRLLHTNEKAWGPTVGDFDPARFVKKKTLARQPYYRPFAGGPTYCPGRTLAKHETYAFVATLLHRFNIKLLPLQGMQKGKQPFPRMESCRPPTGVKGPAPGTDLILELEEKKDVSS